MGLCAFLLEQFEIPEDASHTFRWHLTTAITAGMMFGAAGMVDFVAAKALNAPPWQISALAAIPGSVGLLGFLGANLAEARRKVRIVCAAYVVGGLMMIMMGMANRSWEIVIFAGVFHMAFMISLPAGNAIITFNYPMRARARLVGFIAGASGALQALSASLFGWLLDGDPQRYHYVLPAAGMFGLAAMLAFRNIRARGETEAQKKSGGHFSMRECYAVWKSDRNFRNYMIFFFMMGFGNLMSVPVFTLFLKEEMHASYKEAALAIIVIPQGLAILTAPFWGRWVDRAGPLRTRVIVDFVYGISYGVLSTAHGMGTIAVVRTLWGLVSGGGGLVWSLGTTYFAPPEKVHHYMGLHVTLAGLRSVTAPFLGMWLSRQPGFGARGVFVISCTTFIISALGMWRQSRIMEFDREAGLRKAQ
ncbi:MAG TPA: MFS transporter [Candidatus Brocadiia bacterium]|nr:MFS transporter [Candidatus Brocadiia bacterium]